jgi:FAD/FMN-containing dehydrogenase
MARLTKFMEILKNEFPDDRLTFQKAIPTFHPESPEEAAGLFRLANREKQRLYITGFGNNITPAGEKFDNLLAVKSDRLNNLLEVVGADYYIRVGGGYPLKELNKELKKYELFFPHADLPYVGSVGGALASGLTADYRGHKLPISRYFIMSTIVDPKGQIIKPGSACFKSVSGLDIVKIFSPSWGLLGMIVTATLRVMPTSARPEYEHIKMHPIDYDNFARIYRQPGDNVTARYSIKIKEKFDPGNILPLIDPT